MSVSVVPFPLGPVPPDCKGSFLFWLPGTNTPSLSPLDTSREASYSEIRASLKASRVADRSEEKVGCSGVTRCS